MRILRQNAAPDRHLGNGRVFPAGRTGFTLLETVIALGLCGLILSATGTATHLYWKYRSITQGQIQAAHLLRGLAEDLSADLRSAMPPRNSALNDPAEMSSSVAAFSDNPEDINRNLSLLHSWTRPTAPLHFLGTARTLAVFQEYPNRRFTSSGSTPWRPAPQHVIWWVNDGSSQKIPLERIRGALRDFKLTSSNLPGGLLRTTRQSETLGVSQDAKTGTQLISEQVRKVTFRYFDGNRWLPDWNSSSRDCLPSLVEITISLSEHLHSEETFVVAIPQGTAQPPSESGKARWMNTGNENGRKGQSR